MMVEIYTFSIFIIAGIVNVFILLGITALLLNIIKVIQGIYGDFVFNKMITRTNEDIEYLVKKRLKEISSKNRKVST